MLQFKLLRNTPAPSRVTGTNALQFMFGHAATDAQAKRNLIPKASEPARRSVTAGQEPTTRKRMDHIGSVRHRSYLLPFETPEVLAAVAVEVPVDIVESIAHVVDTHPASVAVHDGNEVVHVSIEAHVAHLWGERRHEERE